MHILSIAGFYIVSAAHVAEVLLVSPTGNASFRADGAPETAHGAEATALCEFFAAACNGQNG